MRIYTRGGDSGSTGLFGGKRVAKGDLRVQAYGDSDELNAHLGWCAVIADQPLREMLQREQQRLLDFGAHLATPSTANEKTRSSLPKWDNQASAVLESEIDQADDRLEPLKNFILPGGTELSARLHIARTVCRRCERSVCLLATGEVEVEQFAWLNRLSDWLFTQARVASTA